jgi:phage portal protein BeeE
MGLIDRLRTTFDPVGQRAAVIPAWLPGQDNYWPYANIGGLTYPLDNLNLTMPGGREEEIESNFPSYVGRGFKGNGIVFSIMRDRMALFSQARFKYQSLQNESLFGKPSLDILEHPWANATTGDLLARAISDVDLAGNHYATRRRTRTSDRIVRMRPDWVTMVFGTNDTDVSADDLDAEFLGIIYYPGGEHSPTGKPVYLQRDEIAHFAPIPDPTAYGRGMSWLTPIVREVMADGAATSHKLAFFQNGATPQMIVKRADAPTKDNFLEWRRMIEDGHTGAANAYRTLYLTNGADATVVGKDLQQLEFKATQGAGETRIAAAGGIHPVVAGLSEGMQGASLNAGNFATARRLTADKTLWWLWGNYCGSMETLVPPPTGSRLWVDASGIPFLREDRKDAAEIALIKAQIIETYIRAGFKADDTIKATAAEDETVLIGKHTGLFSVQLQAPGGTKMPEGEAPGESPVGPGTAPEKPMTPMKQPMNGTKPAAGAMKP